MRRSLPLLPIVLVFVGCSAQQAGPSGPAVVGKWKLTPDALSRTQQGMMAQARMYGDDPHHPARVGIENVKKMTMEFTADGRTFINAKGRYTEGSYTVQGQAVTVVIPPTAGHAGGSQHYTLAADNKHLNNTDGHPEANWERL